VVIWVIWLYHGPQSRERRRIELIKVVLRRCARLSWMPERFWTRKIGTSIIAPQQMSTIAVTDYIEEMNGDGCARDTTMQLRIAIKEGRTKESELVLGYIADEVA
jgi:hypothetical protein